MTTFKTDATEAAIEATPTDAPLASGPVRTLEYFEVLRPPGDGRCSDNRCPCPNTLLPRGSGFLYISPEAVEFRKDARTVAEGLAKKRAAEDQYAKQINLPGAVFVRIPNAVLMCEQGARLRGLDLTAARSDAKFWWETGLAPLRATPLQSASAARPSLAEGSPGDRFDVVAVGIGRGPRASRGFAGAKAPFLSAWTIWSFVPWLNWIAWLHAAMRTRRGLYAAFAIPYAVPLVLAISLSQPNGPNLPTWVISLNSVLWLTGIAHVFLMRKKVNAQIAARRGGDRKTEPMQDSHGHESPAISRRPMTGERTGAQLLADAEEILLKTQDAEAQLRERLRRALASEVVSSMADSVSETLAREIVSRLGKEKARQVDTELVANRAIGEIQRYMNVRPDQWPANGLAQIAKDIARGLGRKWWQFWRN